MHKTLLIQLRITSIDFIKEITIKKACMHKNWAIKINGLTGGYKVVSDNTCIYILKIMRIREKERETKVRVRGSENRN